MTTIQRRTVILRDELENWRRALDAASTRANDWIDSLEADAVNLPTATAQGILAEAGFCVVHKDQLDSTIACVELASTVAVELGEKTAEVAALLAYLKSQRQFAD